MKVTFVDFSHCKTLPPTIIIFVEMVSCQVRVVMGKEKPQLTFGEGKFLNSKFACDGMVNQSIQQFRSTLKLPLPLTYSLM
jgi:hypothetical protein